MSRTVAILCAARRSVYHSLPDLEVYDEARDARTFAGGMSIVAHPPCRRWTTYGDNMTRRLKLDPAEVAAEKDLGVWCAEQVKEWGGILEQPAKSRLWAAAGLPLPGSWCGCSRSCATSREDGSGSTPCPGTRTAEDPKPRRPSRSGWSPSRGPQNPRIPLDRAAAERKSRKERTVGDERFFKLAWRINCETGMLPICCPRRVRTDRLADRRGARAGCQRALSRVPAVSPIVGCWPDEPGGFNDPLGL